MAPCKRFRFNNNVINLCLDFAAAISFIVVLEERFTGLALHELIGVGLAVGLIVHILLHWRWIIGITRTFFRKVFHDILLVQ